MGLKCIKFLTVTLMLVFLSSCKSENIKEKPQESNDPKESIEVFNITKDIFADNIIVPRAIAAKMLAVVFNDLSNIEALDREINFTDTGIESWYDKYINAIYLDGVMQGYQNKFMPNSLVTIGQAQQLMDKMDPNNEIKIALDDENRDKPISFALWLDFYKKMLASLSGGDSISEKFGITEKSVIVLATPANNRHLKDFNMITDRGHMTFYGLNMDGYIDKEIRILEKDNDVIAIVDVVNTEPTINAVYIVKSDSDSITIFTGGVERTYRFINSYENLEGKIADIKINNNELEYLFIYDEIINDVIKRVSNNEIEFENLENYRFVDNLKVYSTYDGGVKWKSINNIMVGCDSTQLIVQDGLIYSAVITKEPSIEKLRISVSTTDFNSPIHNSVKISATRDFTIKASDNVTTYKAWEEVNITDKFFNNAKRIYIEPTSEEGRIVITSIKRNWPNNESPKYRGKIEVAKEEAGFTIVNEVDVEQYLYSVVPSEIPSSFGVEASMVQAITARSYAYNQFLINRFRRYGANIDDSVSSQVYNNIPESDVAVEAVNRTKGQYLIYDGRIITANFFSSSSGITANNGEVWGNNVTKQFPAYTNTYLTSQKLYDGKDYGDLSKEQNMRDFITDMSLDGYDSKVGWFRWNVEMSSAEISASLNANLKSRYNANPPFIKTLQSDNVFRSKPVESIGKVVDITIKRRSSAGNIMEMIIEGTENTILVRTEYNVRALIKPYQYISGGRNIVLNRHDGTFLENYSIMPSAFYVMDKVMDENNHLVSIKFHGGGNGHGVGMSQNAVKGMLDRGYSVEQILAHFFKDTEIITK